MSRRPLSEIAEEVAGLKADSVVNWTWEVDEVSFLLALAECVQLWRDQGLTDPLRITLEALERGDE